MKLPKIFHRPAKEARDRHADIAAALNKSGEEGTLVLSTDNLVKKYRQRTVVNHV